MLCSINGFLFFGVSDIYYFWNMKELDLLFDTRKHWSDFQINLLIDLINKVEKQDIESKVYQIKAKNVLFNKLSFDELRIETQFFLSRIYEVQTVNRLTQLSILSSITFIIGKGLIEVKLHPLFKAYFLELKERYTLVTIKNLLSFKSIFSKKLYLLLKKSNEINFTITINKLKEELDLIASYRDYNTFKKRIILQSQKELHNTDMSYFFEEIKKSRKVEAIEFKQIQFQNIILSPQQKELQNKLIKETKITETQSKKIVIKFMAQEVYTTLFLIKDLAYSGRIKTSLAGYTVSTFNRMLLQKI